MMPGPYCSCATGKNHKTCLKTHCIVQIFCASVLLQDFGEHRDNFDKLNRLSQQNLLHSLKSNPHVKGVLPLKSILCTEGALASCSRHPLQTKAVTDTAGNNCSQGGSTADEITVNCISCFIKQCTNSTLPLIDASNVYSNTIIPW